MTYFGPIEGERKIMGEEIYSLCIHQIQDSISVNIHLCFGKEIYVKSFILELMKCANC